jgi:hypothetical protein
VFLKNNKECSVRAMCVDKLTYSLTVCVCFRNLSLKMAEILNFKK